MSRANQASRAKRRAWERSVGEYLNKLQSLGGAVALAPMIESLVAVTDENELRQAYDRLSPEGYAFVYLSRVSSGMRFADALLSCRARDGDYRFSMEQECGWLSISTNHQKHDAHAAASGYESEVDSIAGGMQWALNDRWYAGLAASFDRDSIHTQALSGFSMQSASGRGAQLGAVMKGVFGNTTWSTSLSGSLSNYDTDRRAYRAFRARSNQDIFQSALQMRLAHAFDFERWYVRPTVDVGVSRVELDGFREHEAGPSNLIVGASDDNFVHVRPALEAGFDVALGEALARFSARFGITRFLSGGDVEVAAALEGAPLGGGAFEVTQAMDRTVRELAAGVDVFTSTGLVLRLGYSGQFAANGNSNGATLKFTRPF